MSDAPITAAERVAPADTRSQAGAPEASVVVATHNRVAGLTDLLSALARQSVGATAYEVIVVDDGSRDATPQMLAELAENTDFRLTVLRQPEAAGPARARNRGWRTAQAPVVVFTDDDCVPADTWLEALLQACRAQPGVIVQGKTLPDPVQLDRGGPFSRSLQVSELSPHFETANIAYPRAVLERLGGFDEGYGAPAGEDTDLGWRARDAGVGAVFVGEALVHHAVHERGAVNTLRDALRATDCVRPYRDHPELRQHLDSGLFFHPSHPLFAQAALALVVSRRSPAAALLAVPYCVHLIRRSRALGAGPAAVPFLAARDAVEIAATLRGAVRYRTLVL